MSDGPILKDAVYYAFWGVVGLCALGLLGAQVYLLARILRELRGS